MVPQCEEQNFFHRWVCGLRHSIFPLCNNNAISDHQKTMVSASTYLSENSVEGWFRVLGQ